MNNLTIRSAVLADAAQLAAIYAPYVEKTAISFEYEIPSTEEFARRISAISQKYPYLVAEVDGVAVGYAYAAAFKERAAYDWCVETTIYLKEDCKGLGIGRRLYEVLIDALEAQGILNVNACIAWCEQEDETLTMASPKFHERMGFTTVALFHQCGYKFDRWYDMIWMEKLIGDRRSKQPLVRPFPEAAERFWADRNKQENK